MTPDVTATNDCMHQPGRAASTLGMANAMPARPLLMHASWKDAA